MCTHIVLSPLTVLSLDPLIFAGTSDRGASIRIPLPVQLKGYGYLEDRRPAANVDPYVVARLLIKNTLK